MQQTNFEQDPAAVNRKGVLIVLIALALAAAGAGGAAGTFFAHGEQRWMLLSLVCVPLIVLLSYGFYRRTIVPYFRRIEDANLELHLKQEELLDMKDDLFIKFLGIYDVNYAANSPRLFPDRLKDVADITARAMDANVCLIFMYDKKKDELELAATNGYRTEAIRKTRIPLGQGIEGWVGRRLEPVMQKDFHKDQRFRELPELMLSEFTSVYCLPLYVYSNGALVGAIEVLYSKAKNFSDEEINFFTTLAGIISTTVQNEDLQTELRKMNVELEQWVAEKIEELRSSEERYRTLVEHAAESIFVLAENGDILFANEQAVQLTGVVKYDLVHKNLFEVLTMPAAASQAILAGSIQNRKTVQQGDLKRSDGTVVPVEVSVVELTLMGKRFIQSVVRDMSAHARLEKLVEEQGRELAAFRQQAKS
jgi:PAS domain S-box-containing protein